MNNTTKIITAFATGAIVGAIAGVLFAPDKGSETRRKIGEQGKKTMDSIKNRFATCKENLSDLEKVIKKNAEEVEEFA